MFKNRKISLVIPCKDEEYALELLLKRVPKFIDEIIVVDNNSRDKTRAVAKRFGAKVVRETRSISGIGYGYAHQAGLSAATGEYIVAMDGDNSYPTEKIITFIRNMEKNNIDFASCRRFPLTTVNDMSPVRQLGSRLLTTAFNVLFGRNLGDILTGMWILRRSALPHLDLTPGDWNFSISIKGSAALSQKIKFAEFHIPYHDRHLGSSKQALLSTGWGHLFYLLNWRWQTLGLGLPSVWTQENISLP